MGMVSGMTTQQKRELTWPLVALAAVGAGFVIGVFLIIPEDMPEMRTALLGVLMTFIGGIVTAVLRQLDRKIEEKSSEEARGRVDSR